MKKVKKDIQFGAFFILCILLFSCVEKNRTTIIRNADLISFDFDHIEKTNVFNLSTIFRSVKPIVLDNKDILIGHVNKVQPYEDKLFILDSQTAKGVYVFSREGSFVQRIGQVGNAAGEYISCDDFTINEQSGEIYIYDSYNKRINKYDVETGDYKGNLELGKENWISRIWVNSGRLYAVNNYFFEGQPKPYYILKQFDTSSGDLIGEWMNADVYNKGWQDDFITTPFFYPINENTDLFAFGLCDSIMCIHEGEIYPYMVLTGEKTVQKGDISVGELETPANIQMRSKLKMEIYQRLGKQGKIVNVSEIFVYGQMAFLKCSSWNSYFLQYDKMNQKTMLFEGIEDDVLFSKPLDSYSVPSFLTSDNNGVYYLVKMDYLPELKYFASEKGILSDSVENKEKLKNLDENSNPVILYYEYQK